MPELTLSKNIKNIQEPKNKPNKMANKVTYWHLLASFILTMLGIWGFYSSAMNKVEEKTKIKKERTDKQIEAFNKAVKIREEKRLQRKKDKEEEERKHKEILDSKILLKAKRIKKAQEKVLGNLDEIEYEKPKKIKKKVIIYKSESESESDNTEEEVIIKKKKPKPKQKQVEPIVGKKYLPDNNHVISNPTYRKVINFV